VLRVLCAYVDDKDEPGRLARPTGLTEYRQPNIDLQGAFIAWISEKTSIAIKGTCHGATTYDILDAYCVVSILKLRKGQRVVEGRLPLA
jgi:hypothetical protein